MLRNKFHLEQVLGPLAICHLLLDKPLSLFSSCLCGLDLTCQLLSYFGKLLLESRQLYLGGLEHFLVLALCLNRIQHLKQSEIHYSWT